MIPESLARVLPAQSEFVTGQFLPAHDGTEPVIYYVKRGCIVLIDRNNAAGSVYWPGDLVSVPSEGARGPSVRLRAVAESTLMHGRLSMLLDEASRSQELTQWLWAEFGKRETDMLRRLELLTAESVERRVLLTVADLADRSQHASPGQPMPLAQNEIAELAGATRETTSTLLNRMRRRGMVELGRRRIQVPAPDVLRALSSITEPDVATAVVATAAAPIV